MLTISGILNIIQIIILCVWVYILYKEVKLFKQFNNDKREIIKRLDKYEFLLDVTDRRLADIEKKG